MKQKLKYIIFIGILSILALLFIPNEVNAATYKDNETGITWYYSTSGYNAVNVYVSSYTTLPETLVIPDSINGYTVTSICGTNSSLYYGSTYRYNIFGKNTANTEVKNIVIPETVKTIGVNTFANFQGLTSIVIPDNVLSISAYAFYNCINITEIKMPATAVLYTYSSTSSSYTERAVFYNCNKISKITITPGANGTGVTKGITQTLTSTTARYMPWYITRTQFDLILEDGITQISDYSFYNGSYMKSVKMPNTLEIIGMNAFYYCTKLKEIELPDTLKTVKTNAFYYCNGIQTMNFPTSITAIGNNAFSGCINWKLENITFSENITELGQNAFYNCKYLTGTLEFPNVFTEVPPNCFYGTGFSEIKLPDTVTTIKNGAFQRCLELEKINMPTSLVSIEKQAFEGCTKLKGNLEFPDTCTTIGEYAFQSCTGFDGKLTLGANLASIGNNAFFGCTGFKEAEIKDGVITKVANNMFSNFKNLEKVTLGDSVTEIGEYAFQACTALKEMPMNDNITIIGNYAFQNCNGITTLNFGSSVETIGQYAFKDCSGITGDVILPDSIKTIGANAFNNCSGINGTLQIGKGMDRISKFTFYGCPNIAKFIIPNTVKVVEKFSLWGISDVYYLGTEDEVEFSEAAGGSNEIFVHYKNCTHKLNIDVPAGYEVINAETGDVLTSSEYTCGTKLKLSLRTPKDVSDLSVVVSKQGKYKNSENVEEKFALSEFNGYEISTFNRDYTILVKDVSVTTDLSLRNYIYQVNYNNLTQTRVPNVENENGIISYKHTKVPVEANTGDLITFKVRVYNEGNNEGLINEITEYLPEGLVLANSETNRKYGWVAGENGKVSTKYFENKPIAAYSGNGSVPYEEISFICKVTSLGIPNATQRLVVIGEITSAVTKDSDSVYGQINSRVDSTFKNEEAYASTPDSYVKCDDDDTDFENIAIKPSMPVEYTIKVTKVDSDTQALLSGAVFNLKDIEGNIVSTAATNEEGVLSFGLITSYGEGTDIFYIEEALAPEGYKLVEKETIEVNVTKTIIDEVLGTYSLKVICQTLNYSTDITRYDYNPIATPEHLAKVGSGEWIEYDGFKYQFNETANYKLVNDIDLDGIVWTPINKKITGIFDGNNHSIKNLTIASNDLFTYSEVGLFRSFSGIVQGLNMENVNIYVPGMVTPDEEEGIELDTISGYTGIGAFAGFMEKGTVKSCSVSGNIYSGSKNVGGFIGHSSENNIIKFQNCTNSATIEVSCDTTDVYEHEDHLFNVGGLIGCAIGSLSLNDCTNEGTILGNGSNVGGLVGFVNSTGYEETAIKAEYSEDDKTIGLVIENVKATGKYDIILENRDVKTLGFITGAKYTVYDSKLNEISGFENIQLENGKLRVASVDINYVGTDTYYIKEQNPAPGYSKLKSYVKLVISREWNAEKERFDVTANADNILDNKIQEEPKQENTYKPLESTTGEVFAGITEEVIGFYNDKVSIVDCSNKGSLTGFLNVGGLLGTAYCNVQMNLCNNTGAVSAVGFGKAGGLIAEVRKQSDDNLVEIQNCTNEGEIFSTGNCGSSSGIIAHSYSDIKVTNCLNKGVITAGPQSSAAGIIADLAGTATIRECTNEADITAYSNVSQYSDVNNVAGGIVGKHMTYKWGAGPIAKEDNNIYIYDCLNTGNIDCTCHLGGIVGLTTGKNAVIQNSVNKDSKLHAYCGDNGGMVGFTSVSNLEITNCVTKNTEFSQVVGGNRTYGYTGGMVGTVCAWNADDTTYNKFANIKNCEVLDCYITSVNKETAGILGGGYIYDKSNTGEIKITDCNVERCNIENKDIGSTYGSAAGVLGVMYEANTVTISNCNVKECEISVLQGSQSGYDANVAGILAMIWYSKNISLTDCNVENCNLNNTAVGDSCANTSGIVGGYSCDNTVHITNCDVTNCELSALSGNLAGTLAFSYSKPTVLKDCDNKDVILFSTSTTSSNSNTGGIVATSFYEVTVDNCSFTGSENSNAVIYGRGRNVSGLVACQLYGEPVTILNSEVKNVIIESEGGIFNTSNIDAVSGILGNTGAAVVIKDCVVEDVEIEGLVGNASGVMSDAYQTSKPNTFENILVKNAKIKNNMTYLRSSSNSTASGMTGYAGAYTTYTNCRVEDSEIIGYGSNTAGIVAALQSGGKFANCSVKDLKVTKAPVDLSEGGSTRSVYTSAAGIVGTAIRQVDMIGCSVENVEVNSDCYSTGGMGGFVIQVSEFKDNTINGLTIKSSSALNNSSNGTIGGFVADVTSTYTSGSSFTNCDIKNFTVESSSNHIGGIVGTSSVALNFDGCDVDNMQAKYTNEVVLPVTGGSACTRSIGGIIAVGTSEDKTISNCTVKNSNLTAKAGVNANSALGALAGYGTQLSFANCDVTNTKVINETTNGMAGGILGASQSSRTLNTTTGLWEETYSLINYDDVQVKDSTISALGAAGGVHGYGVANVANSGVNNCTIEDKLANSNGVGGIVGMSLSIEDSSVKNTSVTDSTIKGKDYAGGISGFTSGAIDNCTVSNTIITTDNANNGAGGIAGMTYDASNTITNSTVSGTSVTSANYAGGIVGFTEGNLADNKVNSESTVTTTSESYAAGGILGLTSNASSEITNCDVDQVTVKAVNGYAGGIAGFANNTISGADVNNATIIATGTAPTKVGGILGQASSETATTTVVATSTIANTSIQTIGTAGKVAGDGLADTTGCTVDDATVVITTPTASMNYGAEAPEEVLDELVQEEVIEDEIEKEDKTQETKEEIIEETVEEAEKEVVQEDNISTDNEQIVDKETEIQEETKEDMTVEDNENVIIEDSEKEEELTETEEKQEEIVENPEVQEEVKEEIIQEPEKEEAILPTEEEEVVEEQPEEPNTDLNNEVATTPTEQAIIKEDEEEIITE